jgi:hypothetical protein
MYRLVNSGGRTTGDKAFGAEHWDGRPKYDISGGTQLAGNRLRSADARILQLIAKISKTHISPNVYDCNLHAINTGQVCLDVMHCK